MVDHKINSDEYTSVINYDSMFKFSGTTCNEYIGQQCTWIYHRQIVSERPWKCSQLWRSWAKQNADDSECLKPTVTPAFQNTVDKCFERSVACMNHGTTETPVEPLGGPNLPLTCRSYASYSSLFNSTATVSRSWLFTSVPTLFCFCELGICTSCPNNT